MRRWRWVGAVSVAIILLTVCYLFLQSSLRQPTLSIENHVYTATILEEENELIRGLSGSDQLPPDHVMLFDFGKDSRWGIWMKDMNYPIDIIWLDIQARVIYMVQDAQPSSYPDTIYRPKQNARYVIEAVSGTIERTGLKVGDSVTLPQER